jgi:hypothetical protein
MIVDKYYNFVRKFMWQLCERGRVVNYKLDSLDFLISQFIVTNLRHSKLLLKILVAHNMKNDISLKVRILGSNLFLTREYLRHWIGLTRREQTCDGFLNKKNGGGCPDCQYPHLARKRSNACKFIKKKW